MEQTLQTTAQPNNRTALQTQVILCVVAFAATQMFFILKAFLDPNFARDVPFLCGNILVIMGWCVLCSSLYRYVRKQSELIDGWLEYSEYTTSLSYECTRLREENEKLLSKIDCLVNANPKYTVGG